MKTRAAVLRKGGTPWEITELELDPPKANEVLIQMEAAGLCHSDEHIRARGFGRLPMVGGHYIPVCGKCRYCSTGKQNLCDAGKWAGVGCLQDETFRFHQNGEDFGGMCVVGSFAEYSVLSEWSCVMTHAFGDPVKAKEVIIDLTRGQLADKVICTVGEMDNEVIKAAVDMTGKAGTIVITGVGYYQMELPGGILIGYHRRMQGSLFGGANPLYDIPMILSLWHEGKIKLTELITRQYTLDEINEGYQDLMDGKNIRGVIVHQH